MFKDLAAASEGDMRLTGSIFESAFPLEERMPWGALVSSIREGQRSGLITFDGESEPAGLAIWTDIGTATPSVVIEYLAVKPDCRSRGIGGQLLEHVVAQVAQDRYQRLVLEVESPSGGSDDELRLRRIEFYRRHAFEIVGCAPAYAMPDLSGSGHLFSMLLMERLLTECPALNGIELIELVTAVWNTTYAGAFKEPQLAEVIAKLVC